MLELPRLKNNKKKVKRYVHGFGGINKTGNFFDGECENCVNLDADALPYLKAGRGNASENVLADDLIYAEGIVRVVTEEDGQNHIYYRPEKDNSNWTDYNGVLTAGKKEVAMAGGKVLVMPDKKILDMTEKYPAWKSIEREISYPESSALLYGNRIVFDREDDFKIFANAFKEGDVVSCSGGYYQGNVLADTWDDRKLIIRGISTQREKTVTFDPYTFGDTNANDTRSLTFKRIIPDITCLCSWNDRVWGVTSDGKIYASKYQDPTNFEYFDLTSADSFTLDAGSGGAFTGSCATGSYIAFFRQNKIHRITGTRPSNYRHTIIKGNGVQSGSERSLAVIGDIIYYEGKDGFYVFNGTDVRLISEKLGDFVHSNGIGAFRGDEYYISVKNGTENYELYRYHTRKGIWVNDGEKRYLSAVNFLGELYYVDEDRVINRISDDKADGFLTTLRAFDAELAEKKGYMRLCIGYEKGEEGCIDCYVSVNGEAFMLAKSFNEGTEGVYELRLTPNRGDRIRVRLCATGDATVKYLMREFHTHGTVY